MSWTVFLPGKWPSLNQLNDAKANYHAYHGIKKRWQQGAALIIKAARIPHQDCVRIVYVHHRKDKRSDKSNLAAAAAKIIEDALVDAKVIDDDGWNYVDSFEHRFVIGDREGVEVTVTAVVA